MLIPIAARSTEQFCRKCRARCAKARWRWARASGERSPRVIVPAARKGILTGMILGVARISGETAPLLFTSLNNQYWSTGLIRTHGFAAGDDLHPRDRALRGLAPAGVGRGAGAAGAGVGGQHRRPHW